MSWKEQLCRLISLLKEEGIKDEKVLEAMRKIPRHLFVPENLQHLAYENVALPIGYDQTISQPYTVAFMLQALQVQKGYKVLEIGTGSGYLTALLLILGAKVFTVERVEPLVDFALNNLRKTGLTPDKYPLKVFTGDGTWGLYAWAPFDRIIVSASSLEVPQPLLVQLRYNGVLVMPLKRGFPRGEGLYRIERIPPATFKQSYLGPFLFVPLKQGVVRKSRHN